MPSSSMARPASLGAISRTSRSPVGRENPYTVVTTKPPIQSSRTSSRAAASNSRRNESHVPGILSFGCVGKIFSLHVGQEIPVGRSGRAMLSQPCSLSLGHRVVAEGIFACKPGSSQNLQPRPKLSRPLALLPALRHFTRQRDSKSQSVLPVMDLGVSNQPVPVHINVGHNQPWQPLSNTGVKVWFVQCLQQDLRGVPSSLASKIGESWITERAQFRAEIALVRRHGHRHFLGSQRQRRSRQIQHLESLAYKSFRQRTMPLLHHRQVGLGDIKRQGSLLLRPVLLQSRLFQQVPVHNDPYFAARVMNNITHNVILLDTLCPRS